MDHETDVDARRACAGGLDAGGRPSPCAEPVAEGTPVPLCTEHLGLAADWAAGEHGVGTEDVLPSPCLACGSRLGVRWPSGWLCAVCEWRHGEVPEGDLAPPRVDVVYYLRFAERIKIGTSANPRQRLAAIRHEQLLAFERGDRHVEHARHEQFAAQRQGRSEWFTADAELLEHVRAVAAGQPDPWATWARWRSEALALRG
ncbi:T5orf172 domain-containing protein [Frigoribacterium sp. PhB160]|uniref:GIY-YIG nuclease family protein n=1 Tax=Frigoribacterium sp. PhB160 TaxID=2485192 RepID=UPI000F4AACD8|nr:GIY-YIG nuclease family protein [Frigoribacterium sp. PhB160]ROS58270.1 T5orf172 domain-containing protein [Frigoribacterium sp. PhB160]